MKNRNTAKDRADFALRVREIIRLADGRANPDPTDLYELIMDWTQCGPLYLHVSEDESNGLGFVAGRFLHPERAVALLGAEAVNKYSGKWNHHYWSGSVDEATSSFQWSLRKILPACQPEGCAGNKAADGERRPL